MTEFDKYEHGADEWNSEISPEDLEEISGGRIKLAGYAALTAAMLQYKQLGKDKEYCMEAIRKGWNKDCDFKTKFTNGTDDDLQKALSFIESTW